MMTVPQNHDRPVEVSVERRNAHRTRSFKGATLRFNNGYSVLSAVVKNFSEGGAMLAMGDTAGVPTGITMTVAGEGHPRQAHVIWRMGDRLGVQFDRI